MTDDLLIPLNKKKLLKSGTIIRRIGKGMDHQCCFLQYNDAGEMMLINIIDINTNTLIAGRGTLDPQKGEKLYYYNSSFLNSPAAKEAIAIIENWPPYKAREDLQSSILHFIRTTYVPEQILDLEKKDTLSLVFIPVQQKFRIGRFEDRRNPERTCAERFRFWLESLNAREHITYVAQVLERKGHVPKFYSIGSRPHQVTTELLQNEAFNFQPSHGGHVKMMPGKNGKKHFIVDAGSYFLGRGKNTPIAISTIITKALHSLFPEFDFTPVEGRGAFGTEQSY